MTDDKHPGLEHDPDAELELDERLHAEDLVEDPQLDSEALLLCGLLWSTATAARPVMDLLKATDFARPAHATLFELMAEQVRGGRPHDPASIAAVLTHQGARGQGARVHGGLVARALAAATTAEAAPESTGHHAVTVVTQAAEQLPTDELFDHLVDIGRTQRTATERLQNLRTTLDTSRTL